MTDRFNEKTISFELPKGSWFRFENCAGYASIGGASIKEMDVVWYDVKHSTWWLIECKDFTQANIGNRESLEHWIENLSQKTADVFFMFAVVQLKKAGAIELGRCFPKPPANTDSFEVLSVVNCRQNQEPALQFINDAYKHQIKGRCALMGVSKYSVMSYRQAKVFFNWIR